MSEHLRWTSCSRTDVGMVRQLNEDACVDRPEAGLWAVADGMGGHTAGDLASGLIRDSLAALETAERLSEMAERVEDCLLEVNRRLREIAAREENQTIGSTVVALVARRSHALCLWAGDSRLYRLRDGRLVQVSQDHAHVQELVDKGVVSPEDAAGHPLANLVTRAVGAADELHVDAEIVTLRDGDVLLLCSDGLDKEVTDTEIAGMLAQGGPRCDALVDLALSRGSRDNVTVVCVEIRSDGAGAAEDEEAEEDTVPGLAGSAGTGVDPT